MFTVNLDAFVREDIAKKAAIAPFKNAFFAKNRPNQQENVINNTRLCAVRANKVEKFIAEPEKRTDGLTMDQPKCPPRVYRGRVV